MRERFHDICDVCGVQGEEYSAMYTCTECGADVCGPKCGFHCDADYSYEGPETGYVGGATCTCKPCEVARSGAEDRDVHPSREEAR